MLNEDEQTILRLAIDGVRQSVADRLGPNRSYAVDFIENLHRSVDKVMQQGGGMDCRAGCAGCCTVRVEAIEPEIFRIVREIRKRPPDRTAALIERLQNFVDVAAVEATSHRDCAFLEGGLCSIYGVRPAVCRKAHSLSTEHCRSFAPEIPQDLDRLLRAEVLIMGTSVAYRQTGLHASAHELCGAILQALTDGTAEARWLAGEPVFPPEEPG